MDLTFDDETEAFRVEVADFLAANKDKFPLASYDTAEGFEQHRRWDMVLFDADKIIDRADYGAFRTRCEGLNYVIVGGKTAAENAVFTGAKAGRIIRRP